MQNEAHPDLSGLIRVEASSYPEALREITQPLSVSDPLLNDIIALCENTLRSCLFDGFVDNPWRESAQWIGDALPNSLVLTSMTDDVRPVRRVLELATEQIYPDGMLPTVLPSEAHAYAVVDFNFQWVELLYFYWQTSGDDAFVAKQWPALVSMLDCFAAQLVHRELLHNLPGRRLFIDWAPISKEDPSAIYNLHFLLALQLAVEMAESFNADMDAARWRGQAEALQAAIRRAFWRDERWYDDRAGTTHSQLAAAMAILTGTATVGEASSLLDALVQRSLGPDEHDPGAMVLASPYMHHRLFQALREAGRWREVVEIVRFRWGRWVRGGYPTAWENWNVDFPDGSECHGFSAHPRYHLAKIAGEQGDL